MRNRKLRIIHCASCGNEIKTYAPNRMFCDECRTQRKKERERCYIRIQKIDDENSKKKKPDKTIEQVIREAEAAGMSYGKYLAMIQSKEQNKGGKEYCNA